MRRVAIGGVLTAVLVVSGCTGDTAEVAPPEPSPRAAELCRPFVEDLPETLYDEERVTVAPESEFVAAWGDPAITVRCGVERPEGLRANSELLVANDIAWFAEPPDEPERYTAVGREAYVELTIPRSYGAPAAGLARVSETVEATLPELPPGEL